MKLFSNRVKKAYLAGQSARMNRVIDVALRQLKSTKAGKDIYNDDAPFIIPSNAIRSTNSMDEKRIDLCSTNNSTPCMLQNVTVPLLAVARQASFQNLIQKVEINYLNSKNAVKDFIVVERSMTSIGACTNCARAASEYTNARKNFFDYAAKWLNDRF